jgi:hypothetical protein
MAISIKEITMTQLLSGAIATIFAGVGAYYAFGSGGVGGAKSNAAKEEIQAVINGGCGGYLQANGALTGITADKIVVGNYLNGFSTATLTTTAGTTKSGLGITYAFDVGTTTVTNDSCVVTMGAMPTNVETDIKTALATNSAITITDATAGDGLLVLKVRM